MADVWYWFGSGFAFATGVVCGVLLLRFSRPDDRQLREYRAEAAKVIELRDETNAILERIADAIERYMDDRESSTQ